MECVHELQIIKAQPCHSRVDKLLFDELNEAENGKGRQTPADDVAQSHPETMEDAHGSELGD